MIQMAGRRGLSREFLGLICALALLLIASPSKSRAQSEAAAPEHPAAAPNKQDLTAKGAMKCCKLEMEMAPKPGNRRAAMECCELGKKGMPGTPNKESAMECCKLGSKGAANVPEKEDPKPEQK